MKKILIMGLPGSGKTTLARKLKIGLKADWLNADKIRKKFNDWDFSKKGVLNQANRMKILAGKSKKKFVIADFICPFQAGRKIFEPDYLIWMDTIKKGRLSTFNKTFQKPRKFDLKITSKNAVKYSKLIVNELLIVPRKEEKKKKKRTIRLLS